MKDKFLLTGLLALVGGIIFYGAHHQNLADALLPWATQTFATILGALLLLVTGNAVAVATQKPNAAEPLVPGGTSQR